MIDSVLTATATTPALLENVSVLASITVALLTIGSVILGTILFVYKVHISTIANTKEIEAIKLEKKAFEVEYRRLELALVEAGVISATAINRRIGGDS